MSSRRQWSNSFARNSLVAVQATVSLSQVAATVNAWPTSAARTNTPARASSLSVEPPLVAVSMKLLTSCGFTSWTAIEPSTSTVSSATFRRWGSRYSDSRAR